MERVIAGEQSPLFFGSAMTNFGVQLFLDKFCAMGTKPSGRLAKRMDEVKGKKAKEAASSIDDDEGDELIGPEYEDFTGFVFKTQGENV
jgi:peptide chain release factor 3